MPSSIISRSSSLATTGPSSSSLSDDEGSDGSSSDYSLSSLSLDVGGDFEFDPDPDTHVSFEISRDNLPYTRYLIRVHIGNRFWESCRRYRQLRQFHLQLLMIFPYGLPQFPRKKRFRNTKSKFLEQRRAALESYFAQLVSTRLKEEHTHFLLDNFFLD